VEDNRNDSAEVISDRGDCVSLPGSVIRPQTHGV